MITVEHDRAWHDRVSETISAEKFSNIEALLIEPSEVLSGEESPWDPSDPALYQSDIPGYRGASFYSYAAAIDRYPDGFFDLILVDGRARSSCMKHALSKICPGGCLVLDDAERSRYQRARALLQLPQWTGRMIRGLRPYPFQGWRNFQSHSFRGFLMGSTAIWEKAIE